jgi:hypothetical protein
MLLTFCRVQKAANRQQRPVRIHVYITCDVRPSKWWNVLFLADGCSL